MKIVAFGDSITAAVSGNWPEGVRWPVRLEAGLRTLFPGQALSVVNAGVGGNTAREGWARFERDVTPHGPGLVTIEFGGNDATPEPARRVGLEEFRELLLRMIARCRELGAEPVLLPFPPVIDPWHAWPPEVFREKGGGDRFIEDYRELTRRVAVGEGVLLIDIDAALRRAMRRQGVASQIMPDGVHLTPGGNLTVALAVLQELAPVVAGKL